MTTTITAPIAFSAELIAARAEHSRHLGDEPAPTRRQVATVLRTMADFAHARHLALHIESAFENDLHPSGVTGRYFHQLATALAGRNFTPGKAPLILAGMHPAKRIALALGWPSTRLDLARDPVPSLEQAAAVMDALVEPQVTDLLVGPRVANLAEPDSRPGWQRAVGLHHFFTQAANHLIQHDTTTAAGVPADDGRAAA